METKTFLIVLGAIITFIVLGGIWFISNSISEQSNILEQIPNTTQSKFNQDLHYNNSIIHFGTLEVMNQTLSDFINGSSNNNSGSSTDNGNKEIDERQEQDHELLVSINKTLSGLINDIPPTLATR